MTGVNDLFLALTPDRVLEAAEVGGWRATGRVLQLNSLENRVYDVELEDERNVVMKFYRPARWSREQILEEHRFLAELVAADVPVVAPNDLGTSATLHEHDGIFFAGFDKGRGRAPEELTDEQLEWIGRLLARLHTVGDERPAAPRLTLSAALLPESDVAFVRDRFVPPHLGARYHASVMKLLDTLTRRLTFSDVTRIHGDCHLGNLLWNSKGPFFLDFDDFCAGPPVQDVWMVVPGRDDEAHRQREVLLDGYETMRSFDRSSLALIEPLRTLRILRYQHWIARRWHDPAFPRAFPDFEDERYWLRELRDLDELATLI
jgi:Ser/Thr protein kinase RdoA (MazF antagonist)